MFAEVLEVLPGHPAAVAGVCEGYVLVEINDQAVVGETWFEVFENTELPFSLTFLTEAPVQLGSEDALELISGPYDTIPSVQYEDNLLKRDYSAPEKARRAALRQEDANARRRAQAIISHKSVRDSQVIADHRQKMPWTLLTFNGVRLADSQSLALWTSWGHQNILPDVHAVVAFDKHNVLDTISFEQASKMSCLSTQRNALAVLSRGPAHWKQSFNIKKEWHLAAQAADIYLYTEAIHHEGPVCVYQVDGMPSNAICIDGDKGDVAALLGLPVLLFDDRERNLDDIIKKGVAGCEGVLVRRGDASQREVRRDWRSRVINDPEDWIHQALGFIKRMWPGTTSASTAAFSHVKR